MQGYSKATLEGRVATVKLLLRNGSRNSLHSEDEADNTPAKLAEKHGFPDLALELNNAVHDPQSFQEDPLATTS